MLSWGIHTRVIGKASGKRNGIWVSTVEVYKDGYQHHGTSRATSPQYIPILNSNP